MTRLWCLARGRVRDLLDVVGSDLLDFGQLIIAGMKTHHRGG